MVPIDRSNDFEPSTWIYGNHRISTSRTFRDRKMIYENKLKIAKETKKMISTSTVICVLLNLGEISFISKLQLENRLLYSPKISTFSSNNVHFNQHPNPNPQPYPYTYFHFVDYFFHLSLTHSLHIYLYVYMYILYMYLPPPSAVIPIYLRFQTGVH